MFFVIITMYLKPMEYVMSSTTVVTCRVAEQVLDYLDTSSEDMWGQRKRSFLLDQILRKYKLRLVFEEINGEEDFVEEVQKKPAKKMMSFSLTEESKKNLIGISNQTGLSQAQVIEIIINYLGTMSAGEE